jgi:hypothetical protein
MQVQSLAIYEDLFRFATGGQHLGSGIDREVYVCGWDDSLVIKVQRGAGDFQNQAEWSLWCSAKARLKRWLAPCHAISPSGLILLQARCLPIEWHKVPDAWPAILGDMHDANIGMLDGKVVAQDYGRNQIADLMSANVNIMKKGDR